MSNFFFLSLSDLKKYILSFSHVLNDFLLQMHIPNSVFPRVRKWPKSLPIPILKQLLSQTLLFLLSCPVSTKLLSVHIQFWPMEGKSSVLYIFFFWLVKLVVLCLVRWFCKGKILVSSFYSFIFLFYSLKAIQGSHNIALAAKYYSVPVSWW